MIFTKRTPIDTLVDGEPIYITKDVSLDSKLLEFLFINFPNSKISIVTFSKEYFTSTSNDVLYNEEELQTLVNNADMADKYNREITFDDEYTLEQAIIASRKLNDNADYINGCTINGQHLSPLEKFTLAYSIVINKIYQDDNKNSSNPRNIISTLSSDKIVCCGYANELSALCQRIGVPCTCRINSFGEKDKIDNHSTCIINIQDEKYGINGVYVADPTGDAKTAKCDKTAKMHHCYRHFLLTHDEYQALKPNNQFDKAIVVQYNPSLGFVDTPIQNIHGLYPNEQKTLMLNTDFVNKDSHELNFDKIKIALKQSVSHTLPNKTTSSDSTTQQSNDEAIERIIALHLVSTLSKRPLENFTHVIDSCYKTLNQRLSANEIKYSILNKIDQIPNQDLLSTYLEFLEYDETENHLSEYMTRYSKDLQETQPIKTETLAKLFTQIFSKVINLPNSEAKKLANFHANAREEFISQIFIQPIN